QPTVKPRNPPTRVQMQIDRRQRVKPIRPAKALRTTIGRGTILTAIGLTRVSRQIRWVRQVKMRGRVVRRRVISWTRMRSTLTSASPIQERMYSTIQTLEATKTLTHFASPITTAKTKAKPDQS